MQDISIRQLTDLEAARQVEEIQMAIWDPERPEITANMLRALQYNGAALHGAFDGERLIGFAFAVLGMVPHLELRSDPIAAARLQLYSHQLAVLPDYQRQGIGYQLKLAQKGYAERIGIRQITWTFDPLLVRNAWLNISRLGGIVHTYLPDFYDFSPIADDRFYLEWWITSNRVKKRLERSRRPLGFQALSAGGAQVVNPAQESESGSLYPADAYTIDQELNLGMVEIPDDFDALLRDNLPLAERWRSHARALFSEAFQKGFVVTDFVRGGEENGRSRAYYLITHQEAGRAFDML